MWYKKKAVVSCTRYGNTSFVVGHNSPAEKYVGRTGLYADQVLEGNATLVLRNVTPNDQGKYFCITMTAPRTDESGVISLVVRAPVQEVDIEFGGDSVTCRAEGIYPAPTLTWSIDPPTDAQFLLNKTKTQKNKFGFYDIQSSLRLMENNTINQTCICCVTSNSSRKTAFLKREAPIEASAGSNVKVPCSLPHSDLPSFNITWRFRHSDPILSISGSGRTSLVKVWDQWKPHVSNSLSAKRELQLYSLKPEHQGTFACEVRTPEETYVTWTEITVTDDSRQRIYIYIIVALCYFLCLSYVMLAVLGFKIKKLQRAREQEDTAEERVDLGAGEANADLDAVEEEANDG